MNNEALFKAIDKNIFPFMAAGLTPRKLEDYAYYGDFGLEKLIQKLNLVPGGTKITANRIIDGIMVRWGIRKAAKKEKQEATFNKIKELSPKTGNEFCYGPYKASSLKHKLHHYGVTLTDGQVEDFINDLEKFGLIRFEIEKGIKIMYGYSNMWAYGKSRNLSHKDISEIKNHEGMNYVAFKHQIPAWIIRQLVA